MGALTLPAGTRVLAKKAVGDSSFAPAGKRRLRTLVLESPQCASRHRDPQLQWPFSQCLHASVGKAWVEKPFGSRTGCADGKLLLPRPPPVPLQVLMGAAGHGTGIWNSGRGAGLALVLALRGLCV